MSDFSKFTQIYDSLHRLALTASPTAKKVSIWNIAVVKLNPLSLTIYFWFNKNEIIIFYFSTRTTKLALFLLRNRNELQKMNSVVRQMSVDSDPTYTSTVYDSNKSVICSSSNWTPSGSIFMPTNSSSDVLKRDKFKGFKGKILYYC